MAEVFDNELHQLFIQTLPEVLDELLGAYQEKNWPQLEFLAHRLHGGLCYLNLPELKSSAKQLDSLLRQPNFSVTEVQSLAELLFAQLRDHLAVYS